MRVVLGDGRRLPMGDRSVDAVTTIWLPHLLDDARPVIAEAAGQGLRLSGESRFVGHGQGRSGGPDPVFRLLAFTSW
ncbi:hypothetical protein GCM10009850_100740 [Nonomuraea monospora]|uniref:Methyltransferase type 11 domain-containing protein n=1 Tax=Nonomuraea monospora TaxID=568818 RepID=A0ABP5PSH9_9ACTN